MRRSASVLLLFMLVLWLAGCAGGPAAAPTPEATPTPAPTVAPTPTPVPTPTPTPVPLSAPAGLAAAESEEGTVVLTWTDGDSADSFIIERKLCDGDFEQIAQVEPGVGQYTDTDIARGGDRIYRVAACDDAGGQEVSTEAALYLWGTEHIWGNFNSGGIFAYNKDGLFYRYGRGVYYLDAQTEESTQLNKDEAHMLNLTDQYLFYLNNDSGPGDVCRIDVSGENFTTLAQKVTELVVVGDVVYYDDTADGGALYAMDLDGANQRKIIDADVDYVIIDGSVIYFQNESDGDRMYRYDMDSGQLVKLTDVKSDLLLSVGDYIYFQHEEDADRLYRVPKAGGDIEKVLDMEVGYLNIYHNQILFANGNDGDTLYSYNIDTGEVKQLTQYRAQYIFVALDMIFHMYKDQCHIIYPDGTVVDGWEALG